MKYLLPVIVFTFILSIEVLQCTPLTKIFTVSKKFQFELKPFKSFSFLIEHIPFGKFEFKHSLEKRDTGNVSPALNELPKEDQKVPLQAVIVPEVIFAPPKPEGVMKTYSFLMPPEFLITPPPEALLLKEPPKPPAPVVEPVSVITTVVEVTPKPIEIIPVVAEPVNVVVTSPSESPIPPPPPPAPVFLTEVDPNITPLHTDITKVPLYSLTPAYPTPVPILQEIVVVPATTLLPPPLPPPPKEEPHAPPPVVTPPVLPHVETPPVPPPVVLLPNEERPNYLIKGSRLILFFGTKILQMLSKFIEGGVNQIASMPSFPVIEE